MREDVVQTRTPYPYCACSGKLWTCEPCSMAVPSVKANADRNECLCCLSWRFAGPARLVSGICLNGKGLDKSRGPTLMPIRYLDSRVLLLEYICCSWICEAIHTSCQHCSLEGADLLQVRAIAYRSGDRTLITVITQNICAGLSL